MMSVRHLSIALGLLSVAQLAALTAFAVDDARLRRFFDLMDADGSGRIDRPEFQTGKGMVFMAIDEDGSLTLTQNEMRLSPEGFKQLSGDDKFVDGTEFLAGDVASFAAIDHDDNLEITYDELRDYVAKFED